MRDNDGRQLSSGAQEERRRLAVDMKQDGATLTEICDVTGMNATTVCRAWSSFQEGGYEALKGGRRGRREGEKRSLSEADAKRIRKKIIDRLPGQLKLDFALWTRGDRKSTRLNSSH